MDDGREDDCQESEEQSCWAPVVEQACSGVALLAALAKKSTEQGVGSALETVSNGLMPRNIA